MLEIRDSPLPPDVLYVMDNALDEWSITPFTHVALSLYGDRSRVVEIVDRERPVGRGWSMGTGAMCDDLDDYAHALAGAGLSDRISRAMFAATLIREPPKLDSLAEVVAGWNVEDATLGGCLQPYRRGRHIRVDRDGRPTKKLRRKLSAPEAIRRYVKVTAEDTETIPSYRRQAGRLRQLPWPTAPAEANHLEAYFAEQRARHEEARRQAYITLRQQAQIDSIARRLGLGARWDRIPRQDRRALRRAAEHAITILGPDVTRDFVAGKSAWIEGEIFVFEVSRAFSLRRSGHSALNVVLRDQDRERLCGLCLFWEDTPALDQLVALALHVRSGEELSLLLTGNPLNVTTAGAQHPFVVDRLKRGGEAIIEPVDLERDRPNPRESGDAFSRRNLDIRGAIRAGRLTGRDAQLLVTGEYVEQHKGLYLAVVAESVWGRDAKRVMQFNREAIA